MWINTRILPDIRPIIKTQDPNKIQDPNTPLPRKSTSNFLPNLFPSRNLCPCIWGSPLKLLFATPFLLEAKLETNSMATKQFKQKWIRSECITIEFRIFLMLKVSMRTALIYMYHECWEFQGMKRKQTCHFLSLQRLRRRKGVGKTWP